MQVKEEQLKRQQAIMKALGFYHAVPDGVWGPDSIKAKKKWESDAKSFIPGIPNDGLPFSSDGPFPAGMTYDRQTGLLHHPVLDMPPKEKSKREQAAEQQQQPGEKVDEEGK